MRMLIIAGHIEVAPEHRDAAVAALADLVRRARAAPGCLDVAITADPVEPGWIHNLERWRSREDLDAWRAAAHAPDLGTPILADHVRMFDATNERGPFD
ncbi:putative quinol monooxygenase [Actinomycetospora straminea]|uniref:ABM domain-containing protein n=1 Tax=Actinomycetospora straminea TaxID=663607 RepID=A0ABP9F643_9PSEU|nr:antibiotic biosynthesis monooxygenase family protein [Actinomycetospora straminea]MDD7933684.1 antibiotic biosynthesis monooxygenase [Actinomycetospora straminea]